LKCKPGAVFDGTGLSGSGITVEGTAKKVSIRGCVIQNFSGDGIRVESANHLHLEENQILNIGLNGISMRLVTDHIKIADNFIINVGAHGIFGSEFRGSLDLKRNILSTTGRTESETHGIFLERFAEHAHIKDNRVLKSRGHGIAIAMVPEGAPRILEENDDDGDDDHGLHIHLNRNIVEDSGGHGISVTAIKSPTRHVKVEYNTVTRSQGDGIDVAHVEARAEVEHNTVSFSTGHGISLSALDVKRKKTGVERNGVSVSGGAGIIVQATLEELDIEHNTVSQSRAGGIIVLQAGGVTDVKSNIVSQSQGDGVRLSIVRQKAEVEQNTVTGSSGHGVAIANADQDLEVKEQTVSGSAGTGISVVRAAGLKVEIERNTVTGSGREGIALEQAPGLPEVKHNTIDGTGTCGMLIDNAPNTELSDNTLLNTGLDPVCLILPPPGPATVTGLVQTIGPTAGGNQVTLKGTNFLAATGVSFGETSAASFTIDNPIRVTAVAPPHAAGTVNVTVINQHGVSENTAADDYLYAPPPTIVGLAPAAGPLGGGNNVTMTGADFVGATRVTFGGNDATSFTVVSATSIVAVAPEHNAGSVDVRVITPGGTSPDTLADNYLYVASPTVKSLSPKNGPIQGGGPVTITGTILTGATAVTFGGAAATFTVQSSTQIVAVAPAHASGVVDVRVTTPGGISANTTADDYTYVPPPEVTGLIPTSGLVAGGATVVIVGTGFTGATGASFGGSGATFTVNSATQISAVAPAHAAGAVDVQVTTPGGANANTSLDDYTYVIPRPVVAAVTPNAGPIAGGTAVTIAGTDLNGTTGVAFGNTAATSFTVDSAFQINAVAPAHAAGAVDVVVTTAGGASANSAADDYTYFAPPAVSGLNPIKGPTAGGTVVTISGTSLSGVTGVSFGGVAANFSGISAEQINATAPAHGVGTVDVVVTTPGGASANSGADDYAYVPLPTITALGPAAGPAAGGNTVTITGANLTEASAVTFGGASATSFSVIGPTQITATVPPLPAGTVDVRVITPGGTSANTAADNYTYVAAPTVTSLAPNQGPTAGGTSVVVTGATLSGATAVTFGGTAATSFTVNSATQVTAVAPAHDAGVVDVLVTTVGGTSANTAADDFTYLPAGSLLGVVDKGGEKVYFYNTSGTLLSTVNLNSANGDARGITTVNGSTFWIVDKDDKKVYSYNSSLALLGTFNLNSANGDARDITTVDGATFWVVDRADKQVYRYNASGSLLGTFNLSSANSAAEGIATVDGSTFWVADTGGDKVYSYTSSGALLSTTNLNSADTDARGIDTTDSATFWVVDNNRKVYKYDSSWSLQATFNLDSANTAPDGLVAY
jgi:hypothetical protein